MNDKNEKYYNDLSISMLKNQEELKQPLSHDVNEILPDVEPHTIISLIGTTNSGKSVLINNIVFKWYLDIFDSIILISPSALVDRSMWAFRQSPKVNIFTEYNDDIINELIDFQQVEEEDELEDQARILLIMDDCSNPQGASNHKSAISLLSQRHRHISTTIIFSCQNYKHLSHSIRSNTKYWIIKSTPNQKELDKISDELTMFGGSKNLKSMYDYSLKDNRYSFLYLDIPNGKAYKEFSEILYDVNTDREAHIDKIKINNNDNNNGIKRTDEEMV